MKDYYQVLGLSRSATQEDIRKAYLHYASKFHPDKHNGDPFFAERFKEVKEAYEILNDFEERWRYDIRKFKKSKVKRHTSVDFEAVREVQPDGHRVRFNIPNLDIFITLFYLCNLATWVLIRRLSEHTSTAIIIRSLFLTFVSTLLVWLMIRALMEAIKTKSAQRYIYLCAYLVLSAAVAWAALTDRIWS